MFLNISKELLIMVTKRYYRQIVIRYITIPSKEENVSDALDWIYQCLGLGDERDEVGKSVFRAIVNASQRGEGISSRDIMQLSEVSQAAIIYHLNQFKRSGLLIKDGRNYYLRAHTLENTLDEMQSDINRRFDTLKEIARKIRK
jgi:predicted transcriptional regulator